MSGLLELREITRTFTVPDSEPLHILTGVNLSVSPGEHVAIVGRSGTGKSTLLNILGLIDKPTSGHYTLSGTDTSRLGESRRAHLRGADLRLRLPVLQPHPGTDHHRERGGTPPVRHRQGLLDPQRTGRRAVGGRGPG